MNISITQAKAKFSQFIRRAQSGESVTITRHGEPVVTLHPVQQHNSNVPKIGAMKGKIEIADDFDELPREFLLAFRSEQTQSE